MAMLKRTLKFGVAAALCSLGVTAITRGGQASGDGEAMINSHLVKVKSSQNGIIQLQRWSFGDIVSDGNGPISVAQMRPTADDVFSQSAGSQKARQRQIDSLKHLAYEKLRQAETFRSARLRQLDLKIDETLTSVQISREILKKANAALDRKVHLLRSKLVVTAVVSEAQADRDAAKLSVQLLDNKITALRSERAAATEGVFLGDNYNDTSYSRQRADDLQMRIAELEAQHDVATDDARPLLVASNGHDLDIPTGKPVVWPTNGRLWRVAVNHGETVRPGDEIAEIADCRAMFVNVPYPAKSASEITMGTTVDFQGDDGSRHAGRVVLTGDLDRGWSASGWALAPKALAPAHVNILVALEPSRELEAQCPVGLRGQATFGEAAKTNRPAAWPSSPLTAKLREFTSAFSQLVDYVRIRIG